MANDYFQASAEKQLRTALFCVIMQRNNLEERSSVDGNSAKVSSICLRRA